MSASTLLRSKIDVLYRIPVRFRSSRKLGISPESAPNLKAILEKVNFQDPAVYYKVDIGYPIKMRSRKEEVKERMALLKKLRSDPTFEKQAQKNDLIISAEEVNEEWLEKYAAPQLRAIAEHYGIFEHLFGDAYFYPQVPLSIAFSSNALEVPVHRGNVIKPSEAISAPSVTYKADPESLWTLILTNPDGHLTESDKECIHWFIGNIPGNNVGKGEVIVDYLQPYPPRGVGFQRLVFILYKQDKKLDFSSYKISSKDFKLDDRTFSTYDFYSQLQDFITPAGLAFFQSDWDKSVTNFFHNVLDIKEPIFEYDFPEPYITRQTWFPLKQPFNLYMDKYRDPKQIAKEYFLRRMKKVHPFEKPKPPLNFPNAVPLDKSIPSWLKLEKIKDRLNWGRVNDH